MKTIYTTLPIYDRIEKQAYERGKLAGVDKPIPIICPITEIPSFQWLDHGDGVTSISSVQLINDLGNSSAIALTIAKVTLSTDSYFVYYGGTLATPLSCGNYYLKITTDNALIYYSDWFRADTVSDCIKFTFFNTCDLGNILYQTAFTQSSWLKSEPMESLFPLEEEGIRNGEGMVVRSFARQPKKYIIRTLTMPYYMVEVFNRVRLHDTVMLTDLVSDTNEVFNLEVDHEWLSQTNKYYAQIILTFDFDETFINII
jgi:hypothetical protein